MAHEKTITIEMDDKFINIPSVIDGKEDPDRAVELYKQGDLTDFGVFDTEDEAISAAKTRSRNTMPSAKDFLSQPLSASEFLDQRPSASEFLKTSPDLMPGPIYRPAPEPEVVVPSGAQPDTTPQEIVGDPMKIGKAYLDFKDGLYRAITAPAVGTFTGGLRELYGLISGDPNTGEYVDKEVERMRRLFTGPVQSEGSKKVEGIVSYPAELVDEALTWASDALFNYMLEKQNQAKIQNQAVFELKRDLGLTEEQVAHLRPQLGWWNNEPEDAAFVGAVTDTILNTALVLLPGGIMRRRTPRRPDVDPSAPALEGGQGTAPRAPMPRQESFQPTQGVPAIEGAFDFKPRNRPMTSESARTALPAEVVAAVDEARDVGAAQARGTPKRTIGERLAPIVDPFVNATKVLVNVTAGKGITPVRDAARLSPTLRRYTDRIEAPEKLSDADAPAGRNFWEGIFRETGRYKTALHDAVEPLMGKVRVPFTTIGRLSKEDNLAVIRGLRGNRPKDPRLDRVVSEIRNKVLDDMLVYMRMAGLKVKKLNNYFPRIYDTKVLKQKRDEFEKLLMQHGIDATDADLIVSKIIGENGIIEHFRLDRVPRVSKGWNDPHVDNLRKLNQIRDADLEPFLVNDVGQVMSRYIEWGVNRAEMVRLFGRNNERLHKDMPVIQQELAQSGYQGNALAQLGRITQAMERLYHPIEHPGWRKFNRGAAAYQYARTLLWATLSSATEPLVILSRGHTRSFLKSGLRALEHGAKETVRTVYRGMPEADATRYARQAGLALEEAAIERLVAAFGGEVTKFTTGYFKATGLSQWTRFNRVWANEAGKYMIIDNLKDLGRGGLPKWKEKKYTRELRELGIDIDEGKAWVERGMSKQDPFYENIITGGIRFTQEVVMHPRASNRPLWHNNPHFKFATQLKGFQITFGNTVVKRMLRDMTQRGAAENTVNAAKNLLVVMPLMVGTAYMLNELRAKIKGQEDIQARKSQTQKLFEALDRTGLPGASSFIYEAIMSTKYGSSPVEAIAGPTVSQGADIAQGVFHAVHGNTRPLVKAGAEALPVVPNLPQVRDALVDSVSPREQERRRSNRTRRGRDSSR